MTRRRLLRMALAIAAAGSAARLAGAEDKVSKPTGTFEVAMTEAEWQQRLTPGAVLGAARARHRARRAQPAGRGEAPRHLPLRRLRPAPLLLGHEVRQPHRLAQLLGAAAGRGRDLDGPVSVHDPHRGPLPAVRRPPGARVRRRADADRAALLHERDRPASSGGPEPCASIVASPALSRRGRRRGGRAGARLGATFAGGCFWCMEPPFDKLDGCRLDDLRLYGRATTAPTYEQVSAGADRPCRGGRDRLRPGEGHLRPAPRRVLAQYRPPDRQRPVLRPRQPVPRRHLRSRRDPAAPGRGVEGGPSSRAPRQAGRDGDRRGRASSGPRRTTTRTTTRRTRSATTSTARLRPRPAAGGDLGAGRERPHRSPLSRPSPRPVSRGFPRGACRTPGAPRTMSLTFQTSALTTGGQLMANRWPMRLKFLLVPATLLSLLLLLSGCTTIADFFRQRPQPLPPACELYAEGESQLEQEPLRRGAHRVPQDRRSDTRNRATRRGPAS